jgi:hypothetical protein
MALLSLLLVMQSISLLVDPGDPVIARRPFARSGLQYALSSKAVNRQVAQARACPRRLAYSGAPFVAFLAGRRMPGNQPDLFIIGASALDASFAQRAQRDIPRCPS